MASDPSNLVLRLEALPIKGCGGHEDLAKNGASGGTSSVAVVEAEAGTGRWKLGSKCWQYI